jgi:molybdopterin/thiamine biosynthesis adenylyltransferase
VQREIIFPAGMWPSLKSHLLGHGSQEQLAFLLAGVARGRGWLRLLVREVLLLPPEAFDRQTAVYLAVKPAFSQAVLRRCYDEGLGLIEVHSHPFARRTVAFSATDLDNEAEKFRYVARKIPHVYHATMVVGQNDLDAHLWDRRRRRAVTIDRVRTLETPITDLLPTSHRESTGENSSPLPWLSRQVLAFGEEAQRRLQDVRVGVVGCGGTGAVVVQMLAHLGVQHLVLVDQDVVELTNLNRLVGATRADARRSRLKVHVARRTVRRVNPKARVRALPLSLDDPKAVNALKGVDLLFGCTDNHGSRLLLNQLAVQYLIPYLDLGAGLAVGSDERLAAAGGQVRLVRPGSFCLACVDGIDRARAAQDLMSTPARQRQVARGYAQGVDVPTPGVLFLNAEVASLALAEFVNLWTGYRTPTPLLYYDLLNARLTPAGARRRMSCIACGEGRGLALGDLEPLLTTGIDQSPPSVPALVGEPNLEHASFEHASRLETEVTHGETNTN